jgi:uncharacterized protein YukE
MIGMTPKEIEAAASGISSASQDLSLLRQTVDSTVKELLNNWNGSDVRKFSGDWNSTLRPQLGDAMTLMDNMVQVLNRNKAAQIETSAGDGGGGGTAVGFTGVSAGVDMGFKPLTDTSGIGKGIAHGFPFGDVGEALGTGPDVSKAFKPLGNDFLDWIKEHGKSSQDVKSNFDGFKADDWDSKTSTYKNVVGDGEAGVFERGEWKNSADEADKSSGKKDPLFKPSFSAGASETKQLWDVEALRLDNDGEPLAEGKYGTVTGEAEFGETEASWTKGFAVNEKGLTAELSGHAEANLVDASIKATSEEIALPLGMTAGAEGSLSATVGAEADAKLGLQIGEGSMKAEAGGEFFVGAEVTGEASVHAGPVGANVEASLKAGFGGSAKAEASYEDGKLTIGGEFGITLGLGFEIKPEITLDVGAAVDAVKNLGSWLGIGDDD